MNPFSKISKNLFSIFQTVLIVLLVVLVVVFVGVLSFESVEKHTSELLDLPSKNETLKFLGIGMGGVLVALQALMSYKRAKAMEQTAEAQADAAKAQADAVSKTEQGQRQDRLKNAIEHLGHKSDSVRLGGAYELFHLAKDTLEEDPKEKLSQTVLDILCAHIRRTTSKSKYREKYKSKPSEEIQSLLTLLFVQEHEVFEDCHINLQGSWLNGAELSTANLQRAELSRTHLQGAWLREVKLQGAKLVETKLQGAKLDKAKLQEANLLMAQLQGTSFRRAALQVARFSWAKLQGADLGKAQLQGTFLDTAKLQGANLFMAQLQGAYLKLTQLRGAGNVEWDPLTSFENRIRKQIGRESDLSKVIFAGGLSQEDVESLVEGLSKEQANELREKLKSHIDKPKSNSRLHRDVITGSYTVKDAEKWIAEYKKAVPETPGDNS